MVYVLIKMFKHSNNGMNEGRRTRPGTRAGRVFGCGVQAGVRAIKEFESISPDLALCQSAGMQSSVSLDTFEGCR